MNFKEKEFDVNQKNMKDPSNITIEISRLYSKIVIKPHYKSNFDFCLFHTVDAPARFQIIDIKMRKTKFKQKFKIQVYIK